MPTRRAALLLGAGLLGACTRVPRLLPGPAARCVDDSALARISRIGSASLPYESDGIARSYAVNEGFAAQLEGWLTSWDEVSGTSAVTAISTYGIWNPSDCSSWHASGRAFDLARIRVATTETVSCRHDLWRSETSDDPVRATARERELQRGYWRLAASLHASFAYVLSHYFDELHDNHLHVDDSISAGRPTRFDPASRVQCQAVAAIATWVHQVAAPVTGVWDRSTQQAARTVLGRLQISGDLTDQAAWQAFLAASARG